jgi:hypothetical protein
VGDADHEKECMGLCRSVRAAVPALVCAAAVVSASPALAARQSPRASLEAHSLRLPAAKRSGDVIDGDVVDRHAARKGPVLRAQRVTRIEVRRHHR